MAEPAISVQNLGKRYLLGPKKAKDDGLRHVLEGALRAPWRWATGEGRAARVKPEPFWALRDISFDVPAGEVVGIIGRNGAGKSTLLKVLSRITEPTTGRIEIGGRVASLLEVGTGFHPELTGRENIYLNGAILGMTRAEIRRKFDEIVAFSEIEKFLDTPVKRYSSGMYVRLAFSVAAHLEPEILIVDEVLAVGDSSFQQKCLGKMEGIARQSARTVLFVSHSMAAVGRLCTQCIVMDAGRVVYQGRTAGAIALYHEAQAAPVSDPSNYAARGGTGELRYIESAATQPHYSVADPKAVAFAIRRLRPMQGEVYLSGVVRQNDVPIFQFDGRMLNKWVAPAAELRGAITFRHPWLKPGVYQVDLYICSTFGIIDELLSAAVFNVIEDLPYPGAFGWDAYRFGFTLSDFHIDLH